VLRACLAELAASPARTVLVSLEDLWLEPRPQNVPGTWRERPNWLRKARYTLEELLRMPDLLATLREVDRLRRQERDPQ
jgi:4-alpha-glucanotransferase